MIKWIMKKFKCRSSCSFNDANNVLDCPNFRASIDILNNNFEITNKDIIKIFNVIKSKKRKSYDTKYSINNYTKYSEGNSFEIYDKNNKIVTEL